MNFKYISDERLWDYPEDETNQAIKDLLDLQFMCMWYKETIV